MDTGSYLALEPLLLERLRELAREVPALNVQSARDLGGIVESELRLPGLHLLYVRDDVTEAPSSGVGAALVTIDQTWAVIVATRDLHQPSAARATAGRLIAAVLALLQGWQPPDAGWGRLRRVSAPNALYSKSGAMYVPLYFRSRGLSRGVTD